jgi:hypothetical protein
MLRFHRLDLAKNRKAIRMRHIHDNDIRPHFRKRTYPFQHAVPFEIDKGADHRAALEVAGCLVILADELLDLAHLIRLVLDTPKQEDDADAARARRLKPDDSQPQADAPR